MKEERKHEIEDIIDNALTEEDCRAWAEGNLTDHVKQLMEEHHIKQMNVWDDVCEIVEFDTESAEEVEEKKTGIEEQYTLEQVKREYREVKPAQIEGYDNFGDPLCVGSGFVKDTAVMVYYDCPGTSVDDLENLTADDIYEFVLQ